MLPDTPIHEPLQANNTLIKNFFIVLEQIIQWSMHMYTIQFSWKEWIHGYYLLWILYDTNCDQGFRHQTNVYDEMKIIRRHNKGIVTCFSAGSRWNQLFHGCHGTTRYNHNLM